LLALIFGLAAALLGLLGAMQGLGFLTAGVGAVTTIAGGIAAYSNVQRHAYLAASYGGMASAIASLLGRHQAKLLTDAQLVEQGEALMAGEYAAWTQRMLGSPDNG
jgi:SMODS and SLOG-associating 2TM effector domain 1